MKQVDVDESIDGVLGEAVGSEGIGRSAAHVASEQLALADIESGVSEVCVGKQDKFRVFKQFMV